MTHPALASASQKNDFEALADEPLLLNKQNAARALQVSEKTLDRLILEHGLPRIQLGRSVRFSVDALKAWIAEKGELNQG